MNKKLLKTLTGLAIVGTALGAAFAYIKKCKEVNDLGEEDFDDLWDGEEENPEVSSCTPCRSYTTIPSDSPVPEAVPLFLSFYLFGNLKELLRETIRLNTSAPSLESFASTQKNPFLTNWKLSYAFASFRLFST